eukprot:CAMPEP_0184398304 /NCGR_PEP_ID=MMETSP0007-20130409/65030_1 /TAXON_ID=97485 /ORGANISM="Prymnesium parvum, Strain Texoma1" /LENGTH=123 /DNA_ID=CAMNT_0026752183 /DNA_START=152 /DNA_END=524 /DNA_ORIENTATION=+
MSALVEGRLTGRLWPALARVRGGGGTLSRADALGPAQRRACLAPCPRGAGVKEARSLLGRLHPTAGAVDTPERYLAGAWTPVPDGRAARIGRMQLRAAAIGDLAPRVGSAVNEDWERSHDALG